MKPANLPDSKPPSFLRCKQLNYRVCTAPSGSVARSSNLKFPFSVQHEIFLGLVDDGTGGGVIKYRMLAWKMITVALFLLVLSCPRASCGEEWWGGSEWTAADVARQVAVQTLLAVDWSQTITTSRDPGLTEVNPILGEYPSSGRVDKYFAAWMVAHPLISHILPATMRRHWQHAALVVQAGAVGNNINLGIRMNF
jgi:hypothetical protein